MTAQSAFSTGAQTAGGDWSTGPMSYLHTFGPRADPVTSLAWGLLLISCVVTVIIAVLVVWGVAVRRAPHAVGGALPPVERGGDGLNWIYVGLLLTVVTLVGTLIWTVAVLARVDSPPRKPALTLEVTGYQWWWGVRYEGDEPAETFNTANEIHIPVGQPVRINLKGGDVIHSFWVPALTGKTDTIPGRTNLTWIQANRPGVYRGQCTEYCGRQHAHMAVYVVAQSPADFAAWRAGQAQPAATPVDASAQAGETVFVRRCGACHTARGTAAGGVVGPDLTHLMSRQTIASGLLPNNVATLSGWIENPQALKPGARMPATYLSSGDLQSLRAYLLTLK